MRTIGLVLAAIVVGFVLAAWLAKVLPGRGEPYYNKRTRAAREAEEAAERAWKN